MVPEQPERQGPDRVLSSWKAIASYLDVSVRTAQSWQERGLPVQRVPGGRARVSARVSDLERWRASGQEAGQPDAPVRLRFPRRAWFVAGGAAFCIIVALAGSVFFHYGVPSSVSMERHAVVVLDDRGRELWRKPFPWLDDPGASLNRLWWIGDLGDGQTAVIVAPPVPYDVAGELVCYDGLGRERWHFRPGRVVNTARETFTPPFRVARFLVERLGRDHALRIAVTSRHFHNYPDQVALLSNEGKVLREYWHPGYLNELVALDLANSGRKQLVLGGINNARRQATIIILDPDRFTGAAVEENPSYQFQGFAPGLEERRLFFPRSCMNKVFDSYNAVLWVHPEPTGLLVAVNEGQDAAPPEVDFHLGLDLHLVHLDASDRFLEEHAAMHSRGELSHTLTAQEEAALGAITSQPGQPDSR